MAFLQDYLSHWWQKTLVRGYDQKDLANYTKYLEEVEGNRRRDRILAWRDQVTADNYAVNAEEPTYYRRSTGFVWRIKDESGKHKARNHQYLYNLEVYGHKEYSRRDAKELHAKQQEVNARVATGQLGPLSPLD